MSLAHPSRAPGRLALAALLCACSSSGPAKGVDTVTQACPAVDAGLENNGAGPGQSLAQGTASGEVSCTLCTLGAILFIQSGYPLLTILPNARLQESSWDSARTSVGTCTTPSALSYLDFDGLVTLSGVTPGTYQGNGPGVNCTEHSSADVLTLSYYPADTTFPDCKGESGPGCPDGCASSCIETGDGGTLCGGCSPLISQPSTDYQLFLGCTDGSPTFGSWTATLTSVEPLPPSDAGSAATAAYQVHGSLTANLAPSNGFGSTLSGTSTPTVTVTVSF